MHTIQLQNGYLNTYWRKRIYQRTLKTFVYTEHSTLAQNVEKFLFLEQIGVELVRACVKRPRKYIVMFVLVAHRLWKTRNYKIEQYKPQYPENIFYVGL